MPLRKAKPPPQSARFRYVRTVAHELGLRFRLGGRGLPGSPHLVFPAHALALFVCDCAAYGHACQPPRVDHPRNYFEIQRRLHRSDLSTYLHVLGHRGWHTHVIFDCATTDRQALEDELRSLTQIRLPPSPPFGRFLLYINLLEPRPIDLCRTLCRAPVSRLFCDREGDRGVNGR